MAARLSIVVVSRGRPAHLAQCLAALCLQDHPDIEIVLVADPAGLAVRPDLGIKRVGFDRANISQARNLGIAQAAGEVIAFIDDDAMAEPGWARRLSDPFADDRVIAATGWVYGPDGLRWQARSQRMTAQGVVQPLPAQPETQLLAPQGGRPVSTMGTNCAFRAAPLREIGGFDPAFAYFLDESDLNMRMATVFPAALTAIVPAARVIHGLAPNVSRGGGAGPHDLRPIGHSMAVFLARHGEAGDGPDRLIASQRARLLRQMVAGALDPFRVAPLLAGLRAGFEAGRAGGPSAPALPPLRDDPPAFLRLPTKVRESVFLHGWHWQAKTLRRRARQVAQTGGIAAILLLTPSFLPHRLRFFADGRFEQVGGLWGRSAPSDPSFVTLRYEQRIRRERELLMTRLGLPC